MSKPMFFPFRLFVCASAVLLTPGLAYAQANKCTDGKTTSVDSAGHCCWPGQVWSNSRNTCVGIPTACPSGKTLEGDACVGICEPGKSVSADTAGHCCWPTQVWSNARQTCVGIPQCPSGMQANGEQCAAACAAGQVSNADTAGNCCWPNQVWSASRSRCIGIPQCPPGLSISGESCAEDASQDLFATLPLPPAPPLPDSSEQPATPEAEDSEVSRVFMPLSKENDSRWQAAADLLFDATQQRIGLRARFDHPFSAGKSSFAIGFGAGLLSPKFTTPGDRLMVIPIEVSASYRLGFADGRFQLVPRVGPVLAVLVDDSKHVSAVFKGSAGAAFRFSLGRPGNRRGLVAGFDVLFPIVGAGWVFLISFGTTL